MIFTDESQFQLFYSNCTTYVRQTKDEEINEYYVTVMVWDIFQLME